MVRTSRNPHISFIKGKPLLTPEDIALAGGIPKTPTPSRDWHQAMSTKWWATHYKGGLSLDERLMLTLRDHLLSFGGHQACLQPPDDDTPLVFTQGELWLPKGSRKVPGRPINCHENSILYWASHRENTSYATGYALSDDGMWREHSWLIRHTRAGGRILETTLPRLAYYGIAYTPEEAAKNLLNYI